MSPVFDSDPFYGLLPPPKMTSIGNVVVIDVAAVVIVNVVVGVVGRRVSVVDVAKSLEKMSRRKRESNLGSLHDMAARFILMAFVVADGH